MHRATPLFEDYAQHHRTPGNKWCHRLGIPMIMLSLFGLLSLLGGDVAGTRIDAAMILIALSLAYYFWLDWRFGVAMGAASIALYLVGVALPPTVNLVIFIAGWVLQFVGHGVYEKRNPAFLTNLLHLLVGPLWIMNDLTRFVEASSPPENTRA